MNEIEELRKEVYDLRQEVEKNSIRIGQNTGDCRQLWMFVQNYLTTQVRKIGDFRVSKKTSRGTQSLHTNKIDTLKYGFERFFRKGQQKKTNSSSRQVNRHGG